jgi:YD repeat-containing protein
VAGFSQQRSVSSYNSADQLIAQTYPSGETVQYTYDAAWRQTSVCGGLSGQPICYSTNATYTALEQPATRTFGSGNLQQWHYDANGRLSGLRLGSSAAPTSLFWRSYSYDGVGNITLITDLRLNQPQRFRYDERNRLISASALTTSSNALTIRARGDYAGGAWPTMELRVNGTAVQSWTVSSASWTTYSVTLGAAVSARDRVDVVYTNDYSQAGVGDRNLHVQTITVGAQTINTANRAVTYDVGALDGHEVYASDGSMWAGGTLSLSEHYLCSVTWLFSTLDRNREWLPDAKLSIDRARI